jgi:hypothetical protein
MQVRNKIGVKSLNLTPTPKFFLTDTGSDSDSGGVGVGFRSPVQGTTHDPDFDSDSDDSSCEEDEDTNENDKEDEDSIHGEDDEGYLSDHLFNGSSTTFQGMRVFHSINPSLAKSYFIVNINGTKKYLHKQTAAWLLANDKSTLSSDRLKRVMTNK